MVVALSMDEICATETTISEFEKWIVACKRDNLPRCFIFNVGPTLADHILRLRNPKNRAVTRSRVETYKKRMLAGEWALVSQGIGIDKKGKLVNGQHRCLAIKEAGRVCQVVFVLHLPLSGRLFEDDHRPWNAADDLTRDGVQNAKALSAAVRVLYMTDNSPRGRNVCLSRTDSARLIAEHPGMHEAVKAGNVLRHNARGVSAAGSAVAYYKIAKTQPPAATLDAFWRALCTGAGLLRPDDPILVARNKLISRDTLQRTNPGVDVAALIVLAWNRHVRNRTGRALTWDREAGFPEVERAA